MFQWHKTYRFWAIFCKFSIVCFPHPNLRFGKSLVLSVLYAVNWTAFAFKIIRHYLHESLSDYMTTVLLFGVRSSKGYEAEIPWTFSNVVQHTPFQPRVVHKIIGGVSNISIYDSHWFFSHLWFAKIPRPSLDCLKNWVWVAVPGRRLARMGSFSGKQQVKFFIQKRSNPTVVLWWIASCLDSLTEAVLVELRCELGLKWKSFKFEIIQTSLVAASCGFHVKGKNLQYVVLTPWPHCYPLLVCSQQYIYS